MKSAHHFVSGDDVTIIMGEQMVDGKLLLISPNQLAGILSFEAILGGYVSLMPISMDSDGVYRDLITHEVVIVLPASAMEETPSVEE